MAEAPWHTSPPSATLKWVDAERGILTFPSPEPGERELCRIGVTTGPSDGPAAHIRDADGTPHYYGWIWHVEQEGPIATVSPSIHFHDHFHSPNPVQFRIATFI